jgi:hypothetical protein
MSKVIAVGATAVFAGILCATPVSLGFSPEGVVSLTQNSASAEIGRPLTATSVAGVNRRVNRRANRRAYYGGYAGDPYRSGYGMYGTYGTYQPSGFFGGYAYQPYNRYPNYQQPYGYRQWWQF